MLSSLKGRGLRFGFTIMCIGTASCGDSMPPAMDQIEIFAPGLEISIKQNGAGQFHQQVENKKGHFNLGREGFVKLQTRTEPYRISHDAMSAEAVSDYVAKAKRCDIDYINDQGGITFHWQGQSVDQFYTVDYGCDHERHAARNQTLREILASLPVPPPAPLP